MRLTTVQGATSARDPARPAEVTRKTIGPRSVPVTDRLHPCIQDEYLLHATAALVAYGLKNDTRRWVRRA